MPLGANADGIGYAGADVAADEKARDEERELVDEVLGFKIFYDWAARQENHYRYDYERSQQDPLRLNRPRFKKIFQESLERPSFILRHTTVPISSLIVHSAFISLPKR